MPNVLILCEYPTLLGGERSMLATLPLLRQRGWQVRVACPSRGGLADALDKLGIGRASWELRDDRGARRSLDCLREDLTSLLAVEKPDLLHANSLSMARISGPVAAELGLASIGHLRDIVGLSRQAASDTNCHRKLLAVSQATRRFHIDQGIDADKTLVVHNGVDTGAFAAREPTGYLHTELGLPCRARLVITIGQIGPRKGTDVALAAMRRVIADHADVHWLVVGERTSDKDESRQFEAQLCRAATIQPLRGHVHLVGTRNDVASMLAECELLVHAARQEPLGRVLLEAGAMGVPVVATDVGGTREIFAGESHGALLVPPENSRLLADAIARVLNDPAFRRQLSPAAHRRVAAHFDVRHTAPQLLAVYEQCISHRPN